MGEEGEEHEFPRAHVELSLDSTKEDRLHAPWVLLVTTGMRVGEATGLQWADIDLDAGTLHIRNTVKWVKGQGHVLGDVKTAHSRPRIVLAAGTVDALRIHQQRQAFARKIAGDSWSDRGLIFCTGTGGLLDVGYVAHAKDRALAAAGLPHVRTHDLRHTAATYLLSQGLKLPRIGGGFTAGISRPGYLLSGRVWGMDMRTARTSEC